VKFIDHHCQWSYSVNINLLLLHNLYFWSYVSKVC